MNMLIANTGPLVEGGWGFGMAFVMVVLGYVLGLAVLFGVVYAATRLALKHHTARLEQNRTAAPPPAA